MSKEEYVKSLNRFEGKSGTIIFWVSVFLPLFFIVIGVTNIWNALRIAGAGDFSFGQYIGFWLEEIDIKTEYRYSGLFLLGLERFNSAAIHFTFAIVMAPYALNSFYRRKRNRSICKALARHGEI